jgi:hypothetical protein
VGKEINLTVFDPLSCRLLSVHINVESRQQVNTPRFSGEVYVVRVEHDGFQMKVWIDHWGRIHREESFPGLVLASDTPQGARSGTDDQHSSVDISRFSCVPVSNKVQNPRRSNYLKLRVKGINMAEFNVGDERQKISGEVLEIQKENLSTIAPYVVPYKGKQYLQDLIKTPFIQSDNPAIRSLAHRIMGIPTDAKAGVRLMTEWVFKHIEKTPLVSNPDAVEILKQRKGDCNEHAVLLAALLRAIGIPARICTGLVYVRDDFYFHAWNEAYVGNWISLDATLNQVPTDATHLKLIEGDLESQIRLMHVIGRLKLEVLESRSITLED